MEMESLIETASGAFNGYAEAEKRLIEETENAVLEKINGKYVYLAGRKCIAKVHGVNIIRTASSLIIEAKSYLTTFQLAKVNLFTGEVQPLFFSEFYDSIEEIELLVNLQGKELKFIAVSPNGVQDYESKVIVPKATTRK